MQSTEADTPYLGRHCEGTTVWIRVQPRASKPGPLSVHQGQLKWGVGSPPEDGKANQELIAGVSKFFRIAKSSISIVQGEHNRQKLLLVKGLASDAAAARCRDAGLVNPEPEKI